MVWPFIADISNDWLTLWAPRFHMASAWAVPPNCYWLWATLVACIDMGITLASRASEFQEVGSVSSYELIGRVTYRLFCGE